MEAVPKSVQPDIWRHNAEGERLFKALCTKSQQKEYDDSFLELLVRYHANCPASEKYEVFFAKYACAYGKHGLALEYAQKAYEKRKLDYEIWMLLAECYMALDKPLAAAVYEALCSRFYAKPLQDSIPRALLADYLEIFSYIMSDPRCAPFLTSKMIFTDAGLVEETGVIAGDYLPMQPADAYRYWVGAYNEQNQLDDKGKFLSDLQARGDIKKFSGCDFVFDIMKSKMGQDIQLEPGAAVYVLPIAATTENQNVNFQNAQINRKAVLGKYAYSFFRIHEGVHISSEQPFAMGEPILLQHHPRRKKLVLNILVDGMSWGQMKKENYKYVPNLLKFFSQGIIFNSNYSVAEYTYPSLATIETGMYPHHTQIFNPDAHTLLDKKYKTLSEQMKEMGYYCVNLMGDGSGIYNGVTRGYDRLIVNQYAWLSYIGVERVIRQLESFDACDNFILLHVGDTHPPNISSCQLPLKAQTQLPLDDRIEPLNYAESVFLPKTPLHEYINHQGIANVDRQFKVLFDYIAEHYQDDEYVISLYSDHGVSIYSDHPYLLSNEQCGAALMLRGAGIPHRGLVDELTSVLDIYPILGKKLGFSVPADLDGNLPETLGGKQREYVISNSIYPGQTYKLCIRTKEYEFCLETKEPVDEDGTMDLQGATWHIFNRDEAHAEVFDTSMQEYFFRVTYEHTKSFNRDGQQWPSMRAGRKRWFKDEQPME